MGGFEPPTSRVQGGRSPTELHPQTPVTGDDSAGMVGQPGIEPGTSVLSGLRSNRLSYWPGGGASDGDPRARRGRRAAKEGGGERGAGSPPPPPREAEAWT